MRLVYLVTLGVGMLVVESEHAYIDLHRRVIVEEHHHTRLQSHTERKIGLIGAGEIIAHTVGELRLSTAEFELHFIEEAETHAAPHRQIVAEHSRHIEVMPYAVEVVHVKLRPLTKVEHPGLELGAPALITYPATYGKIILESIQHRGAYLE